MATRNSLKTNYEILAGTLFEDFESGWTRDSALDTVTCPSTDYFKSGAGSTMLTIGATRANGSMTKTINTVVDIGSSSIWVYIVDTTKLATTGIVFYVSSTTDFSKYFSASYPKAALHNGWNKLIFSKGKWVASSGEDWANTMVRLRIRQYADGTNSSTCYYDKWNIKEYSKPKILIDFDDNWGSAFTEGYGYMQPLGLKGNIYVIRDAVDALNYMTTANLQTVYGAGWDLATHGIYDLTTLEDQAAMETDIAYNKAFLTTNGFTRASDHYAYPLGGYNDTAIAAVSNTGFKTARTTLPRQVQSDEIDNALLLTSRPIISTTTLAVAKSYIDDATAYGGTMRIFFHKLVASPSAETEWAISDFQALMDYILARKNEGILDVVTISEWYNGMTGRKQLVTARTSV